MKVNGKDYPIYEMENKKCLKPPTSYKWIFSIAMLVHQSVSTIDSLL